MQTSVCIKSAQHYKIFSKQISSQIEPNHQKEFIKTVISDFGYNISSKTKAVLFYNQHLKQYDIVVFDTLNNEEDFLQIELFSNAFNLFEIASVGYRVFIYQNSIFIYKDLEPFAFKHFENEFNLDEISDFITRMYGINDVEFTYIKQNHYEQLLQNQPSKTNIKYISLNNGLEIKSLIGFSLIVLVGIFSTLYLILTNESNIPQEVFIEDKVELPIPHPIQKEHFSVVINQFFINLNAQEIILQKMSINDDKLNAILTNPNKEKLFKFASTYDDNLSIKKIIYDNITKTHIMEIEFVIQDIKLL